MIQDNSNRITNYGEVFTSEQEIDAMLDLISDETKRIESRFLEPACGDGNFLINVLKRKLDVITKKYSSSQIEFERYAIQCVGSLYGIDILEDNVDKCRLRLSTYLGQLYKKIFPKTINDKFIFAVEFIVSRNILWGDALTLKEPNSENPIIFSEWSFIKGSLVKRSDYTFSDLYEYRPYESGSLFFDLNEVDGIIPKPIHQYRLIHYLELPNYDSK